MDAIVSNKTSVLQSAGEFYFITRSFSFKMARSSFISLLFIVFSSQSIRMSSALKEEAEGRPFINLDGIQNGGIKALISTVNINKLVLILSFGN